MKTTGGKGLHVHGQFTLTIMPRRISGVSGSGNPWSGLARRRSGIARAQKRLQRLR